MVAALMTVLMTADNPADVEIIREELALARGANLTKRLSGLSTRPQIDLCAVSTYGTNLVLV